jgi:AraC-like DNA-binding protein
MAAMKLSGLPEGEFSETHTFGTTDKLWAVRVSENDRRPFIAGAPVCPALSRYRIGHVGVHDASFPFNVVRTHLSGTFFLACFGGEGRVLADGHWQRVTAGTAFLLLPHMLNAFHAVRGHRWQFCWVRFDEPPGQQPSIAAASPRLARFRAEPLRHAILGLHEDCLAGGTPDTVHHWVELIHDYVHAFARPWQRDDRLSELWEKVAAKLDAPWNVAELARRAHISEEHLRRLCHRELGRSPMHHVTFLRMKRAAQLLAETNVKVEIIAAEVGYQNPFVFSKTFKKWTGWRPSDFPGRRSRAAR